MHDGHCLGLLKKPLVFRLALLLFLSLACVCPSHLLAVEAAQQDPKTRVRLMPTPTWVMDREIPEPSPDTPKTKDKDGKEEEDGRESDISHLLEDDQINVATQESYHREVFWIRKPTAVQKHAQLEIVFDPSYQEVELHRIAIFRDGQWIGQADPSKFRFIQREQNLERYMYDGRVTAVWFIEDLRVGDKVELSYTLRGVNPIFEGKYCEFLGLTTEYFVEQYYLRILTPEDRPLNTKVMGLDLKPVEEKKEGFISYSWERKQMSLAKDLLAAKKSGKKVASYEKAPWVQVSEFNSWKDVIDWASVYYALPEPNEVLKKEAGRIRAMGGTQLEQATEAVRFVQDDIRYLGIEMGPRSHQPAPPGEVCSRRFGDCKDKAMLLCVLLKALDIKAWPAFVHAGLTFPLEDIFIPSPAAFNHAVACVELDGKPYWIDATIAQQGGNLETRYFPDYGASLLIKEGEEGLKPIASTNKGEPLKLVEEIFTIPDYAGQADLMVRKTYEGLAADRLREYFQETEFSKYKENCLEYYKKLYPSIKVLQEMEMTDDKLANKITVTGKYTISKFWQFSREYNTVYSYYYAGDIARILSSPEDGYHPIHVRQLTEINTPTRLGLPASPVNVQNELFEFSSRTTIKDNQVNLEYDFKSVGKEVDESGQKRLTSNIWKVMNRLDYSIFYDAGKNATRATGIGGGPAPQKTSPTQKKFY